MKELSSEVRDQIFNEALSESDSLIKSKDYDKAFISVSKANLYLPYFSNDPFYYMSNLIKIKDRQAEICIKESHPKYDYYLILSLESFALDIAKDLMNFPILSGFNYRKKTQFFPYSEDGCDSLEICPDEDGDFSISLKKLKIFQWKEEIYKEYLDFLYIELPKIYGIPSDFTDKTLSEARESRDFKKYNFLHMDLPEELNKQAVGIVPYEINNFVTNLLKKYYEKGKSC